MPQVTSAHPSFKPKLVARWEKHVENAESNEEAQTQLGYDLLVELRSIKILLVWVLVVVPAIAAVVLLVLVNSLRPTDITGGF